MGRTFYLMLVVVIIITACKSKTKTSSNDYDAIRNIEEQWAVAIRTKDINKVLSIYASDAVEMPPNEPIVVGTEAIKKGWEEWFSDTTYLHNEITYKLDTIEVSASGDLGYSRGTNHYYIKTPKGLIEYDDKEIDIFKKKDGKWECIVGIYNNNKLMENK
jgi:ketosteroid isomerase-like protein